MNDSTPDFPERIRLGHIPLEDEARDELIAVVKTLPLSSEERERLYDYCTALEMGVANSTKIAIRTARGAS